MSDRRPESNRPITTVLELPNTTGREEIGRGTYSVVFSHPMPDGTCYAVKSPAMAGTESNVNRELFALLEVRGHKNIVKIDRVLISDGGEGFYPIHIVLERCQQDLLDYYPSLTEEELVSQFPRVTRQMKSAVDCLHTHNIVHRDIKPNNILVAESPGHDPVFKLGDLGLCRQLLQWKDYDLDLAVPPCPYRPPEYTLALTSEGDKSFLYPTPHTARAADLWMLGVTILEFLTGRMPYPSGDEREVAAMMGRDTYGMGLKKAVRSDILYHVDSDIWMERSGNFYARLDEKCLDLVKMMMAFNPTVRPYCTENIFPFRPKQIGARQRLIPMLSETLGLLPKKIAVAMEDIIARCDMGDLRRKHIPALLCIACQVVYDRCAEESFEKIFRKVFRNCSDSYIESARRDQAYLLARMGYGIFRSPRGE